MRDSRQEGHLAGAVNALREEAARHGANYVEIVGATEPHSEHECFEQEYKLRGNAYQVPVPRPPQLEAAAPTASSLPDATPMPAASSGPGATPTPTDACSPPCSPGYACEGGACKPLCNPPCGPGQTCRMDRTCGPVP